MLLHELDEHPRRLLISAGIQARRCLEDYGSRDDAARAASAAGVALEHAAKAYLAHLHPTLIAAPSQTLFDTLLVLSGHPTLSRRATAGVRTVSGVIACERVSAVLPTFRFAAADRSVFAARDGALHFAVATPLASQRAAKIMVRLIEPILIALEIDPATFWKGYHSTATALLDESADELRTAVDAKLVTARQRLQARLAGFHGAQREAMLEVLRRRSTGSVDYDDTRECPACGEEGVLTCSVEDEGEPEVEYERLGEEEYTYTAWIARVAYPVGFECPVCGLDLEYRELEPFDMEEGIEIEGRDVSDELERYFRDAD